MNRYFVIYKETLGDDVEIGDFVNEDVAIDFAKDVRENVKYVHVIDTETGQIIFNSVTYKNL